MQILYKINENRKFGAVDICKLFMAVAVIAIHTNPVVHVKSQMIVDIVVFIEELAVPFFFISSGFFLFYGLESPYDEHLTYIDHYLKRIIKLYIIWTMLSLPVHIYGYVISGEGLIHCVFSYIKYVLFVGKLYNSYHLWYLLALIYAVVIIRFLLKYKVKVEVIFVVSLFIFTVNYVLCRLMDYPDLLSGGWGKAVSCYEFVFNRGHAFSGILYVAVGMLIAHKRYYLNHWVDIAALLVLQVINVRFQLSYNGYLTAAQGAVFFMLILSLTDKEIKYGDKIRQASTIMYLSHVLFISLYTIVIIRQPNKLGVDSFAAAAVLSGGFAVVAIWLRDKKLEGWR